MFPHPGLAAKIVKTLRKGPLKIDALIKLVQGHKIHNSIKNPSTLQGIYKSLRLLKKQGIVLVYKKEATLNQAWLRQLEKFVTLAEYAYRNPMSDSGHFLQMQDGDRIDYTFKDPFQVDIFWNHVLYVLFDALPQIDRWHAYASHCWFLIARRKEELALRNYMNERGVLYLFTVGGNTALDRIVTKDFDKKDSKYHILTRPLFGSKPNNLGVVLNVFGDYVIEAQYDKETTAQIEKFYKTNTLLDAAKVAELESIVSRPSKIKFSISKNAARATKLRAMLDKNFVLNLIK